jgi:hypothetical protein
VKCAIARYHFAGLIVRTDGWCTSRVNLEEPSYPRKLGERVGAHLAAQSLAMHFDGPLAFQVVSYSSAREFLAAKDAGKHRGCHIRDKDHCRHAIRQRVARSLAFISDRFLSFPLREAFAR